MIVFWSFLRLLLVVVGAFVGVMVLVWALKAFGWQEVFAYGAVALAGVLVGSLMYGMVLRRIVSMK